MQRLALLALIGVALIAGACSATAADLAKPASGSESETALAVVATTTTIPPTITTVASTTPLATTTAAPSYEADIAEIDADLAAAMTPGSWREGCPVPLEDLRLLTVAHRDGDGGVAAGQLIVRQDQAAGVVEVFRILFESGFPIARMELIDAFDGDDDASMVANNTSAFNCRSVAARPGVWSQHAYGTAIDVNPLVNPYVTSSGVFPVEGEPYTDRAQPVAGMIQDGDVIVEAFASIGWTWGGSWTGSKDYQHFSLSGR